MRTAFKEGMTVYDQINFPDMEGKVYEIDLDSRYPISVSFGYEEYEGFYSLEGKERNSFIPTLSTKPYEVELKGFEQKANIPEFHEALEWLENKKDYQTVFEGEVTYPSKEICDASEALRKLIILREYYNEGWIPDWSDATKEKYVIFASNYELQKGVRFQENENLYFKSEEIRDKFFEDQISLLKEASILL